MVDLRQAARVAGLAVTRPVEFSDRLAGRRERDQQDLPPDLDARIAEPISVAHQLAGVDGVGCCAELPDVRAGILGRVSGEHHHDGGTSLAELLWVLVRHRRPEVVVETGVARGISSAFILEAMQRNGQGRLWSIDLPPITADWGRQTGIAVAPDVRDRWTYVRGSSRRKLRWVLSRCGPVDLFVHDGLHTAENMLFEMRAVWPHVRSGGFVVADDVDHNDAVLTFAAETGVAPVLVREPVKHNVVGLFPR